MRRLTKSVVLACAVSLGLAAGSVDAAIDYSVTGSTYTQNFDSLPTTPLNSSLGNSPAGWTNDNASPGVGNFSILGWYLFHPAVPAEGGFDSHQRMRVGAGTANTGAFMSYGNSSDRTMGSLVSSATVPTTPGQQYIGMRLTNNTPDILSDFTLSYNGEQWRDGGSATPTAKTLIVQYSTSATAINDSAAYLNAPTALNFTTPVAVNTGSGAAVDGNVAGRVAIGPVVVSGLTWAPGTDLWIRWMDPRSAGNNHATGIDDISFTASIPEPASATLLLGAGAMFLRRRRGR